MDKIEITRIQSYQRKNEDLTLNEHRTSIEENQVNQTSRDNRTKMAELVIAERIVLKTNSSGAVNVLDSSFDKEHLTLMVAKSSERQKETSSQGVTLVEKRSQKLSTSDSGFTMKASLFKMTRMPNQEMNLFPAMRQRKYVDQGQGQSSPLSNIGTQIYTNTPPPSYVTRENSSKFDQMRSSDSKIEQSMAKNLILHNRSNLTNFVTKMQLDESTRIQNEIDLFNKKLEVKMTTPLVTGDIQDILRASIGQYDSALSSLRDKSLNQSMCNANNIRRSMFNEFKTQRQSHKGLLNFSNDQIVRARLIQKQVSDNSTKLLFPSFTRDLFGTKGSSFEKGKGTVTGKSSGRGSSLPTVNNRININFMPTNLRYQDIPFDGLSRNDEEIEISPEMRIKESNQGSQFKRNFQILATGSSVQQHTNILSVDRLSRDLSSQIEVVQAEEESSKNQSVLNDLRELQRKKKGMRQLYQSTISKQPESSSKSSRQPIIKILDLSKIAERGRKDIQDNIEEMDPNQAQRILDKLKTLNNKRIREHLQMMKKKSHSFQVSPRVYDLPKFQVVEEIKTKEKKWKLREKSTNNLDVVIDHLKSGVSVVTPILLKRSVSSQSPFARHQQDQNLLSSFESKSFWQDSENSPSTRQRMGKIDEYGIFMHQKSIQNLNIMQSLRKNMQKVNKMSIRERRERTLYQLQARKNSEAHALDLRTQQFNDIMVVQKEKYQNALNILGREQKDKQTMLQEKKQITKDFTFKEYVDNHESLDENFDFPESSTPWLLGSPLKLGTRTTSLKKQPRESLKISKIDSMFNPKIQIIPSQQRGSYLYPESPLLNDRSKPTTGKGLMTSESLLDRNMKRKNFEFNLSPQSQLVIRKEMSRVEYLDRKRIRNEQQKDRVYKRRTKLGYAETFIKLLKRAERLEDLHNAKGQITIPFIAMFKRDLDKIDYEFNIPKPKTSDILSGSSASKLLRSSPVKSPFDSDGCHSDQSHEFGNDSQLINSSNPDRDSDELSNCEIPFAQESDRNNAFEFNRKGLPESYLASRLEIGKDHQLLYKDFKELTHRKHLQRQNTAYNFSKADLFNNSESSFNKNEESEDMMVDHLEDGFDRMLDDFRQKSVFLQGIKESQKINDRQRMIKSEAYQKFASLSIRNGETPLPLMMKLNEGTLFLQAGYKIKQGLAMAMNIAIKNLENFDKREIEKAMFDNNGMEDRTLSILLRALKQRPEFSCLIIIKNEIGDSSCKQLVKMLKIDDEESREEAQCNLVELRLIKNKCIQHNVMDEVLMATMSSRSLKKLSLQGMLISERHINQFLGYLRMSKLVEIDISWTNLGAHQIAQLFQILESNDQLRSLNLSFIKMNNYDVIGPHFFKFMKFVKENHSLQHLDVSCVDLPPKLMKVLMINISKSNSLQCIHLTGNVLDEETIETIITKLKPTFMGNQSFVQKKNRVQLIEMMDQHLKKQFHSEKTKIYEAKKLKDIMRDCSTITTSYFQSENKLAPLDAMDAQTKTFVLSKQLGHPEIRNSSHWKASSECYMCEKWKYTLVFWNIKTGQQYQIDNPVLEETLQELIFDCYQNFSKIQAENAHIGSAKAYILGSFTNYEPRRMMQVHELCALLQNEDPNLSDPEHILQYYKIIQKNFLNLIKSHMAYPSDSQIANNPDENMLDHNPPDLDFNRLYVYCDFIKPGKHQYLITYKSQILKPMEVRAKDNLKEFQKTLKSSIKRQITHSIQDMISQEITISQINLTSYHQYIAEPFKGDYHLNHKAKKGNKVKIREFDKNKSLFKDWRLPKESRMTEGFIYEIQFWKVPNLIKDQKEYDKIVQLLLKHLDYLKTVFIIRSSMSNYPVIQWISFTKFVEDLNIFDDKFDKGSVDLIYTSVTGTFDKQLQGIISPKEMSRFQFYESLVRIAFSKFKQSGLKESTYDGLKTLIKEILIPNFDVSNWMDWRVKNIWSLEINDLYTANKAQMISLYKIHWTLYKEKVFSIQSAMDFFQLYGNMTIIPEQITNCWGLCKLCVENDLIDRHRYSQISFVEFLELFARVADVYIKDEGLNLVRKVEKLLDHFLSLKGKTRNIFKQDEDFESISEDELDFNNYIRQ